MSHRPTPGNELIASQLQLAMAVLSFGFVRPTIQPINHGPDNCA